MPSEGCSLIIAALTLIHVNTLMPAAVLWCPPSTPIPTEVKFIFQLPPMFLKQLHVRQCQAFLIFFSPLPSHFFVNFLVSFSSFCFQSISLSLLPLLLYHTSVTSVVLQFSILFPCVGRGLDIVKNNISFIPLYHQFIFLFMHFMFAFVSSTCVFCMVDLPRL